MKLRFGKKCKKLFHLRVNVTLMKTFLKSYISNTVKLSLGFTTKHQNIGVYGELGCFPLYIDILKSCRRYKHIS